MAEYLNYYLPEIVHYDPLDTITTTISGDFNNQFMLFDKAMNKFIFFGTTIASVGTYKIVIKL